MLQTASSMHTLTFLVDNCDNIFDALIGNTSAEERGQQNDKHGHPGSLHSIPEPNNTKN